LSARLGVDAEADGDEDEPINGVEITFDNGKVTHATLEGGSLVLRREGQQDSYMPFAERSQGELLAEELRRLDHDHIYAEALSTVSGIEGLEDRPSVRQHIWHDPAVAEQNGS
jgi:glucose-6-phosphate dehydrogenase assembly protein OpcA